MGFGHRIYKNYDPRAKIIKRIADEVFEVTGRNPLLDIALELERIALADDYFISHRLYPNVDFYSGIIYQAMGFPLDMFPVLFAIGRTPGWLAQWHGDARRIRSSASPARDRSTWVTGCATTFRSINARTKNRLRVERRRQRPTRWSRNRGGSDGGRSRRRGR